MPFQKDDKFSSFHIFVVELQFPLLVFIQFIIFQVDCFKDIYQIVVLPTQSQSSQQLLSPKQVIYLKQPNFYLNTIIFAQTLLYLCQCILEYNLSSRITLQVRYCLFPCLNFHLEKMYN